MPEACIRCSAKTCLNSKSGVLDFCEYGIAYYNADGEILKKQEAVTLRHLSHNLRHELNKVLQTIVSEAVNIDPFVSTKTISMNSPASKIVGATIIIDQFIEMISGVNEFHPARKYSVDLEKKSNLYSVLDKYAKVHSLISNTRRAKNLNIKISCSKKIDVSFAANIIEYLVSILFDNIWKYSTSGSTASVSIQRKANGFIDIDFENISAPIAIKDELFKKGVQQDSCSEGFGYGLYWASLLCGYYNELSGRSSNLLSITHNQNLIDESMAKQNFVIRNVRV